MKVVVFKKAHAYKYDPDAALKRHGYAAYQYELKGSLKKTRISVSIPKVEQVIGPTPPHTERGASQACDHLWDAWNHHLLANFRVLLAQALRDLGIEGEDAYKMPYSRKAGCSCGCSPAFVAKSLVGWDIWVEGEVLDETELGQPTPREEAA
mgnify:CR=1 FL=1